MKTRGGAQRRPDAQADPPMLNEIDSFDETVENVEQVHTVPRKLCDEHGRELANRELQLPRAFVTVSAKTLPRIPMRGRASREEGRDIREAARPRDRVGTTAFRRRRALVGKRNLAPHFQDSPEPRPTHVNMVPCREFTPRLVPASPAPRRGASTPRVRRRESWGESLLPVRSRCHMTNRRPRA